MHDTRPASLPRALLLASFAVAIGYAGRVVLGETDAFTVHLPDDAFYYIGIARWRAELGLFSFDGGQTTTTGFHLLWAYALVPLAALAGEHDRLLLGLSSGLSAAVALGTAAIAGRWAWQRGSAGALGALAVAMSSYGFLHGQVSSMEWSFCVALGAAGFALVVAPDAATPARWLALIAIGALGSIARSDFGGVPVALAFAALVLGWRRGDWRWLRPTLALLAGAVLGFGLVTAHTWALSGEWLSGSARVKAAWGVAAGWTPVPVVHQFARSLLYVPALHVADKAALKADLVRFANVAGAIVLAGGIVAAVLLRHRLKALWQQIRAGGPSTDSQRFAGLAAASVVLFYLVLYSANPVGIQSWYTAHVFVPLTILLGLGLDALEKRGFAAFARLACAVLVALDLVLFAMTPPAYEGQRFAAAQGRAVAERQADGSLDGRIGWSDAGIASFFQGGTLINLDGLVNDDVAAYLPGRLPCYLLDARIRFATSFGGVAETSLPVPAWSAISTPRVVVGDDGTEVLLHEVDFDRIAALEACAQG